MSARLLVLLVVPAYVMLYGAIAPSIKRRFGLIGLIIVAYLLWVVGGRVVSLAHTAPPGQPQGAGNLALVADLAGAVALVIICIQTQRRPADGGGPRDAMRALVIGLVLVTTILLAGLILIAQMAP